MKRYLSLSCVLSLCAALAAGCSSDTSMMDEPELDLPQNVPTPPPGAIVYEFPEQVVPPGTEVQTCYFLPFEEEDVYFSALHSYQGRFGHHLVLFKTDVPEEPGTVRDCTGIADMINLRPVISSVNFGLEEFPPGMALRVGAGTQLVVQQHYVNTSDDPILVRDVAHASTMERDDVEIFAGFYGLGTISFQLQPGGVEHTESFDCAAPRDMNILLIGPHMHEYGVRFTTEVGPAGALEKILDIDRWEAHYRDEPPVAEFPMEEPLFLEQGDVVRTSCTWRNTTGGNLTFPAEMCATYGYYYPAPTGSEEWICGS